MGYRFETADTDSSLFLPEDRFKKLVLVAALFLLAFSVRLFYIKTVDFAPLRQLHSAIIARAMYYEGLDTVPDWEKGVARLQRAREPVWGEPPIMEVLAARAYRLAGGEYLWIPRVFSSIWWMMGGVFLYLISRRIAGTDEGVLALSYYLFLPFGAVASRSFQPDPLMVMCLLGGIFAVVKYFERQTLGRLLAASGAAAIGILVKGPSLFPVFGAFLSLSVWGQGLSRTLRDIRSYIFIFATILPGLLFYGWGFYAGWGIQGQLLSTFLPRLYLMPTYWAGWLAQIHLVVGLPAFVAALVGIVWLYKGPAKALLVGLWTGYALFGLVATYHISTHDYYHLMLIPIVGLSMAPVLAFIISQMRQFIPRRSIRLVLFMVCILLGVASIGVTILQYNFDRHGRLQKNEREIAPEIGKLVNHTTRAVFLGISAGYPLRYYGKLEGGQLNVRNEALEKYLEKRPYIVPEDIISPENLGFQPEYFIVTEPLEFKRQPGLKNFLMTSYPLLAHTEDYLIFDLRERVSK